MHKKISIILLSFIIIIAGNILASSDDVFGQGVGDELHGWAWSDTIGWISFNCVDGGTCASANYGVQIDTVSGEFSGHAWSENIGWISFNRSETQSPPAAPYNGSEGFLAKSIPT